MTTLKIKSLITIVNAGFLVIFFFMPLTQVSQNAVDHHRKYWYFKSRLNNDFLKVGRDSGESIPFMQRGGGGGFTATAPNAVPDVNSGDAMGAIGYYIAVLATEYKLLKLNNQNTDKVKHELFCAIEAINRIDYRAEMIYPINGSGILNGYAIRDDIPKYFARKNYGHFNYYSNWNGVSTQGNEVGGSPVNFTSDKGFASKFNYGVFKTHSSWEYWTDPLSTHGGETTFTSQDQIYNVLFGLAFVNKFVPLSETDGSNVFGYGSGQTSITTEARNITKRIIDNIRDPKDLNYNDCLNPADKLINSWRVRNPQNCNLVLFGDDARAFAYPLAEAECILTSPSPLPPPSLFALSIIPQACPNSGYHNAFSKTAGFASWQGITATTQLYNPASPQNGMDTRTFITNLSAICDCVYQTKLDEFVQDVVFELQKSPNLSWVGTIIGWVWKIVSLVITRFNPGFYTNTTSSAITLNAYPYLAPLDHGPIAHAVLHDKLTYAQNPNYTMQYLLDVAPCDDIYNFGTGNQSHFEWSSDMRLDHPNRRGQNAGGPTWASPGGEYNGLDFLLYHNLHYLFLSQGISNLFISDLSDIYINQPTNFSGNVNAYETIKIENTSFSNNVSSTYWRAGKTISFLAGTTITGNNNLHAYIQKFDCATDLGQFRPSSQDTAVNANDSYPNALYHYQKYPQDEIIREVEIKDSHFENLVTEIPFNEDLMDETMKNAYPEYSRELFIKPTITSDYVRAYFSMEENDVAFINIIDTEGKLVYRKSELKKIDSGLSIDLSSFAPGLYLLKYFNTNGAEKTQKIVKQ